MRYRELIVCRELGSESQHRAPFPNPGGQGEAKRGSVPGHAPNKSESRRTLGILRPSAMDQKIPVFCALYGSVAARAAPWAGGRVCGILPREATARGGRL